MALCCASISARRQKGRLHLGHFAPPFSRLHFGTPPFRRRLSGAAKKTAFICARRHSGWRRWAVG